MQFTSLNKVLEILQQVCESHAQVNRYDFGELFDISTQQETYPLVWANVTGSTISGKVMTINLQILVMDIQQQDAGNEKDTLSDTLSIAQDIYALMTSPSYKDYFEMPDQIQITPIREGLPDLVNGWDMGLNVEVVQLRDRCQVPLN